MLHSAVIKNSFFGASLPRFESQSHNLLAVRLSVPQLPYLYMRLIIALTL